MNKQIYQLVVLIAICLYMPVSQASEPSNEMVNVETFGEFGGFGFTMDINKEERYPEVIDIIENTPAQRAGLKSGDLITHVDGESLKGKSLNRILERTRGKPGSKAELTIMRDGALEPRNIEIVRELIKDQKKQREYNDDYIWVILILIGAAIIFHLQTRRGVREQVEEKK